MLKRFVPFLFVLLFSSALVAQEVERHEYVKTTEGGITTESLDGFRRDTDTDGNQRVTAPNGAMTVYKYDGSESITTPDGHDPVVFPNYRVATQLEGDGVVNYKKLSMESRDGTRAEVESTSTTKFPLAPKPAEPYDPPSKTNVWVPVLVGGGLVAAIAASVVVLILRGGDTKEVRTERITIGVQ